MGKMREEKDRFCVKKIFSTKPGTAELYIPDNIASDNYNDGVYCQKLNRIRNIGGEKTRSNDMCFKKPMVDQEVTGYFKYVNYLASADAKLRGGHHSNGNDDSARCYIFAIKSLKFQKEHPHDGGYSYSMHNLKTKDRETKREYGPEERIKFDLDFGGLREKWIGFKGVTINEGSDKVRCEMYLDTEGIDANGIFDHTRQNWRLWYSVLDEDGKYGFDKQDGDKKRKTSKAWTTAQINSTVQFRVDAEKGNTSMTLKNRDFRFLSAREITRP
jgi:hypothetical protein